MEYSMVIDGRSVTTGQWDDVINPAKGEPFAQCPRGTQANVEEAVQAAARAFKTWRTDEALRRQKLNECAAAIQGRVQDIAAVLSQEQGKPMTAAIGEVFGASMWFSYYANLQIEPETLQDDGEKTIKVVRKPLGVVAAITPWNFPVILLSWKLAPAWLAGNTVVCKPSPYTPLTSLMVADILKSVVPPGVLNVLSGGNELGATLAQHPLVRKISFTGSVATGKKIMGYAVEDLKRITLELGGNDPAIVLDDVDPKAVADGLFWGAFQNSGQVCTAIKRLYVHESVYDELCNELVAIAKSTVVDDGAKQGTKLGPLQNKMQYEKVKTFLEDARKNGKVVAGGSAMDRPGYFIEPTIVRDIQEGSKLVDEEQFGPVLPLIKYSDKNDAIRRANATTYGLGASVWSSDIKRAHDIASQIEAGTVWINKHLDMAPNIPFGGAKQSGIGTEFAEEGLAEFTQLQIINGPPAA